MNEAEYIEAVNRALERWSEDARKKIEALAALIPEKAKKSEITVFMDQDGEGALDIRMALDGPDLYVLNKAIAEHAEIFETKCEADGFSSGLPMMGVDEDDFSVHHVLADCAVRWICGLWKQIDGKLFKVPVWVVVHDDYGTLAPVELKR